MSDQRKRDELAHEFAMYPLGANARLLFEAGPPDPELFEAAIAAYNGFKAGWDAACHELTDESIRVEVSELQLKLSSALAEIAQIKGMQSNEVAELQSNLSASRSTVAMVRSKRDALATEVAELRQELEMKYSFDCKKEDLAAEGDKYEAELVNIKLIDPVIESKEQK